MTSYRRPCNNKAEIIDEPVPGKIYKLTGSTGDPCIAAGNTWAESVVDPIKENIRKLVKDINEQCDESVWVVMDGDYCPLYNESWRGRGSRREVKITEGCDFEIEARLKQIAKENGTV